MAKRDEISTNEELALYRTKLRHRATGWGVAWFFFIIILYLAYVFLAVAPQGYWGKPPLDWAKDWGFTLPYFENVPTDSLLDLGSTNVILRWVTLALVIILAIGTLFAVRAILISSYKGKAVSTHDKALANYLEANYSIKTVMTPNRKLSAEEDILNLDTVDTLTKEYTVTLYDDNVSFDACQYRYSVEKKECRGIVAVTELVQPKFSGFLQLRTFGEPRDRVIGDRTIEQYPVEDERIKDEFTLFSTLSKAVLHAFLSEDFLNKLVKLRRLVTGGIVMTVNGSTLSVLVDGINLRIGRTLREALPDGWLERQGLACKTLFDIFAGFIRACSVITEPEPKPEAPATEEVGDTSDILGEAA